jgi:hypothetical protein
MNLLHNAAITVRSHSAALSLFSLLAAVLAGANGCKWG